MVSADARKKELVGDFNNSGRAWRPKGSPEEVRVHDFADKERGKAIPYGVHDAVINNVGWSNVGVSSDTAAFAVESIRRRWHHLGKERDREARKLFITANCGRVQREPRPVMEGQAAETRTRTRHRDQRVPPAARPCRGPARVVLPRNCPAQSGRFGLHRSEPDSGAGR